MCRDLFRRGISNLLHGRTVLELLESQAGSPKTFWLEDSCTSCAAIFDFWVGGLKRLNRLEIQARSFKRAAGAWLNFNPIPRNLKSSVVSLDFKHCNSKQEHARPKGESLQYSKRDGSLAGATMCMHVCMYAGSELLPPAGED